jgi:uncharacterized protein with NRDE domain
MCTLIVLDRLLPGVPLVAAANRDEFFTRPAAPPTLIRPGEAGGIPLVAPQDLEAGGTWMGVNALGLFVGLTNRPTTRRDPSRRSRGLLVQESLGDADPSSALARIRREAPGRYNPFYLLSSNGRESHLACLRDRGLTTRALGPGVHVLTNHDPEEPESAKVRRIRGAVEGIDLEAPLDRVLAGLKSILQMHGPEDDPLSGVCVHTPGYGTRSSALLALGEQRLYFAYADGAPCETKYRNHSRLLDELQQA